LCQLEGSRLKRGPGAHFIRSHLSLRPQRCYDTAGLEHQGGNEGESTLQNVFQAEYDTMWANFWRSIRLNSALLPERRPRMVSVDRWQRLQNALEGSPVLAIGRGVFERSGGGEKGQADI
jgi:hypothetical protein